MVALLVYLLVACIVIWLAYYIITNFLPEPLRKIATVILMVIGAIFLIYFLLGLVGGNGMSLPTMRPIR